MGRFCMVAFVVVIGVSTSGGQVSAGGGGPRARALVSRAVSGVLQMPSVHLALGEKIRGKDKQTHGRWLTDTSIFATGDGETHWPYASRYWASGFVFYGMSQNVRKHRISIESVRVGSTEAQRSKGGSWTCSRTQRHPATFGPPLAYFIQVGKFRKAVNLGLSTLKGAAVWHIRASGLIRLPNLHLTGGQGVGGTGVRVRSVADYFIGTHDGLLHKISGQLDWMGQAPMMVGGHTKKGNVSIRLSTWMVLSRFGEKIDVQLPKACVTPS